MQLLTIQSETQEAASSTKSSGGFSLGFSTSSGQMPANNSTMTQYHAVGLLYQMRSHDRMALVKMVQQYGVAGAVKNPAATVMLVRLAAQLAEEDPSLRKPMIQLLDGWLRHKSEMFVTPSKRSTRNRLTSSGSTSRQLRQFVISEMCLMRKLLRLYMFFSCSSLLLAPSPNLPVGFAQISGVYPASPVARRSIVADLLYSHPHSPQLCVLQTPSCPPLQS